MEIHFRMEARLHDELDCTYQMAADAKTEHRMRRVGEEKDLVMALMEWKTCE